MKKRIFSLLFSLIIISSFSVNALDRESMKKDNFTGWWFDKETQQDYYFKDGEDIKGWLNNNGYWYYFNQNGEMQTGWQQINNSWYYLSKMGTMKTGWLEGKNGDWYYLNTDGTMAHDTYINGYYVGSDGAWVK